MGLKKAIQQPYDWLMSLACSRDRRVLLTASAILLLVEALLCWTIIDMIPYTEIDWKAYMEQIQLIEKKGERDYSKISGGTGPLVYPGGHVVIFKALYYFTDEGTNLIRAQYIFMALYLLTQFFVLWLYVKHRAPLYVLPLLVLSKRLHSLYLLRLFNDCFSVLFSILALLSLEYNLLPLSSALFSAAVSVKMNALLLLPGAAVVYYSKLRSIPSCLWQLGIPFAVIQLQAFQPFVQHWHSYLTCAYDFSRQFLYTWTVNWKFVPENIFLSKPFANSLLALHAALLLVFITHTCELPLLLRNAPIRFDALKVVALSNILGVLCARSLHYQFYSWFYWTVPYLLYRANYNVFLVVIIWGLQELAWNVFPATPISSAIVVTCLALTAIPNLFTSSRRHNREHVVPN